MPRGIRCGHLDLPSVQKTKQPKRHLVAHANFDVVERQEAVGTALELALGFPFAAHLEDEAIADEKVAVFGGCDR